MGRMLSQTRRGQRVHYVFGEGVNRRLRHLRDGLDELALPAEELLRHGTPRRVYAMSLIENLAGYLLGMQRRASGLWRGGRRERMRGEHRTFNIQHRTSKGGERRSDEGTEGRRGPRGSAGVAGSLAVGRAGVELGSAYPTFFGGGR